MDAGKIRSFIPSVGLRADSGTDAQSGRRSDAGTVMPKVAPLVALDALLTSADADLKNEAAVVVQRPPNGVVVNLSLPALSAEAARQLARAIPNAADYTHLDPHKAHPERVRAETAPESADPIRTAVAASAALTVDRAAAQPSAAATSPDVRPDLYPHGVAQGPLAKPHVEAPAPKPSTSAVTQARDTERLAGLAATPAAARIATPSHFGKLLLGAAIVGALILILL